MERTVTTILVRDALIRTRIVKIEQNGITSEYEVYDLYDTIILNRYLPNDAPEVTIPDRIDGLPVVDIGEFCFGCHDEIRHISFPKTLLHIGDQAFLGCSNLEEVDLPDSVLKVGDGAFSICKGLKKIKLPAGLRVINYQTFANCNLEQVDITLPEKLRIIEPRAFYHFCASRSPSYERWIDSLNDLDRDSEKWYEGPRGLKYDMEVAVDLELELPDSVIEIGDGAFCLGPRVKTKLPQEERWYAEWWKTDKVNKEENEVND